MAEIVTLTAEPRPAAGTGNARALRRSAKVPGVVYGPGQETMAIAMPFVEITREIHKRGFFQHLFDLKVNGTTHRVLPRDVQFHPVTDSPMHVDFQFVSGAARIRVQIGVQFVNELGSPGLKRGGVLNIVRREIEVTCPADAIPEAIIVDLTGLDIGSSVHISHIALPEGVKPTITGRDFTVATVVAPTVQVVESPTEAAAATVEGAEGAEGAEAAPAAAGGRTPAAGKAPADGKAAEGGKKQS
ncbi:MAG: 50S ribosomal protein L25/general stress protein Ctc [Alphaproteobacteria bacterium]|nr:50S ribosomal protein L25/general stress protein Ctc [Alphaproteobacteria bacterium]